MAQSIKAALWGCLEIPLFLKAGISRFENTTAAMKWSFLIPLLMLPVVVYVAPINPDFSDMGPLQIAFKFYLDWVLFTVLYLSAIYAISKAIDRNQYFNQFVNASNWLGVPGFLISLPLYLVVMFGWHSFEEVYNFLICLLMYGFAYNAFLLTYVFRINWMLATGMSILGMAVGQFTHFVVFQL